MVLKTTDPNLRCDGINTRVMKQRYDNLLVIALIGFSVLIGACAPSTNQQQSDSKTTEQLSALEKIKKKIKVDYPSVKHVDPQIVDRWIKESANPPVILDVREPQEYRISHLPGAINLSPAASADQVATTVLKDVAKDHRVVLYCSVGVRSSILAKRLQDAGYTNVQNMNGSIFQWANEDRALESSGGSTTRVHPYNERWGKLLKPEKRAELDNR